jgi:hypothetical protein
MEPSRFLYNGLPKRERLALFVREINVHGVVELPNYGSV